MALIDLKTDLKSLKFGRDRVGGGSSNQPFVQKPIPDSMSQIGQTGGYDSFIRGGTLTIGKTADDVSRLTKLLLNPTTIQGPLFTAKQNLLSRLNVKTQASPKGLNQGVYLPTSTLAQTLVEPAGLHFNTFGVNPIPGLPLSLVTYSDRVKSDQRTADNRLVQYQKTFVSKKTLNNTLDSYSGGPGSVLGVGRTRITIPDEQRTGVNNANIKNSGFFGSSGIRNTLFGILPDELEFLFPPKEGGYQVFKRPTPDLNYRRYISTRVEDSITGATIEQKTNFNPEGQVVNNPSKIGYDTTKPANNKGKKTQILSSASTAYSRAVQVSAQPLPAFNRDKYNDVDFVKLTDVTTEDQLKDDLVPFFFKIYNYDGTDQYLQFTAYLTSFSDGYTANWDSFKYLGRGENFYTYNGFDRGIDLSFQVHARTRATLIEQYKKLNYLASTLAPSYSSAGFMRGTFMEVTVGDYVKALPGVLTNLNYNIPENSPWEIGRNDEGNYDNQGDRLPHLIEVSTFTFKPIQKFIPRIGQPFISAVG